MRPSADIWPQAIWTTERYDEALVPDWRTSLLTSVGVLFGLVAAGIAIVVILTLLAPSAGAAGGCGGG